MFALLSLLFLPEKIIEQAEGIFFDVGFKFNKKLFNF